MGLASVAIQKEPILGRDLSGDVVAVWAGHPAPAGAAPGAELTDEAFANALVNQQLYWSKFNGTSWTAPQDLDVGSFGQAKGGHSIAFSPSSNAGLLAFIEDASGSLAGDEFNLRTFEYDGSGFSEIDGPAGPNSLRRSPKVAYLGNGTAVLVYVAHPYVPPADPYVPPVEELRFATYAGGIWTFEGPMIDPFNAIDYGDIAIVRLADGTGRVLVVYEARSDANLNGVIDPEERGAVFWTVFDGVTWSAPRTIAGLSVDQLRSLDSPTLLAYGNKVILLHHGRIGDHSAIVAYEHEFAPGSTRWYGPTAFSKLDGHVQWQPAAVMLGTDTVLTTYVENDYASLLPVQQSNADGLASRLASSTASLGYDLSIVEADIGTTAPPVKGGMVGLTATIRNCCSVASNPTQVFIDWLDPSQPVEEPIVIPSIPPGGSHTVTTGLVVVPAAPRWVRVIINASVGETSTSNNAAQKLIVPVDDGPPHVVGVDPVVLTADDSIGLDLAVHFSEPMSVDPDDIVLSGKLNGKITGLSIGKNKPIELGPGDYDGDGDIDEFDGSTIHVRVGDGLLADEFTLIVRESTTDLFHNPLSGGDFVYTFKTQETAPALNVAPGLVVFHTILPLVQAPEALIQVACVGSDVDVWAAQTDAPWLILEPEGGDYATPCRLIGQAKPPVDQGSVGTVVCFSASNAPDPICVDVIWKVTNADVDGDGDVDGDDVTLIREFMGFELGDPSYQSKYDLDLDGDVDEDDALLAGVMWRKLEGSCDGDYDYDLKDAAVLLSCFNGLPSEACNCVDFNGDGVVDFQDLRAIILALFLQ